MQQFSAPAPAVLENSTCPLAFMSASDGWASKNIYIYMQILFVMQCKCYLKIFGGLSRLLKYYSFFFCLLPWPVDVLL